ncbi:hypothetical protein ILUMI_22629 [Ignelater luminosus]|uniref:Homologous-pairing protein 2 homolog n=1 Tax=Ignelater luminosus TaxID=2038154 RepID=A0A8K0C9T5_IGNLU|nr:hypothetical protein ILUMI_22629 [Ignelater luminosus]
MATDAAYKFLQEHNRPFSINDLLQNDSLKTHGKAAVQKSLDKLVDQQKVIEKTYGKQKIYCVAQEDAVNSTQMEENLRKIDQEIKELTENLKGVTEKLQQNNNELKSLQSKMTLEEARAEKSKLKMEISTLKTKLDSFQNNSKPISNEEKNKINMEHERFLKEYKKRKRMCMDIINAILEGYPKTKKHLFEDIGIETDEDVGFKLE